MEVVIQPFASIHIYKKIHETFCKNNVTTVITYAAFANSTHIYGSSYADLVQNYAVLCMIQCMRSRPIDALAKYNRHFE